MTACEKWPVCEKWKDQLVEVALGIPAPAGFEEHLSSCSACGEALAGLRVSSRQMDAGLRALVDAEGPSPAFRARLMDSIEARRASRFGWLAWTGAFAGVGALVVLGIILTLAVNRRSGPAGPAAVLSTAPALSEWRSPTEALLRTSADELLKSSPRFGESYFPMESSHPRTGQEDQRRNP